MSRVRYSRGIQLSLSGVSDPDGLSRVTVEQDNSNQAMNSVKYLLFWTGAASEMWKRKNRAVDEIVD